jgi:hypothetical protein
MFHNPIAIGLAGDFIGINIRGVSQKEAKRIVFIVDRKINSLSYIKNLKLVFIFLKKKKEADRQYLKLDISQFFIFITIISKEDL